MSDKLLLRRFGAAAALCLLAACGDAAANLTGSGDPSSPQTESRWDVDVTVRYVHASTSETCDGTDVLGLNNPGEYQYHITAAFGGVTHTLESPGYGSVTGTSYTLDKNENYNFANKTWSFTNLASGDGVTLRMAVTEWDGASKDSYMNDRSNSIQIVPSSLLPSGGTKTDRALGVGKSTCGLTLYYDVSAVQRQVQVGG